VGWKWVEVRYLGHNLGTVFLKQSLWITSCNVDFLVTLFYRTFSLEIIKITSKKMPTSQMTEGRSKKFGNQIFLLNLYIANFLLKTTTPNRPDPKRRRVDGSGIANAILSIAPDPPKCISTFVTLAVLKSTRSHLLLPV